MALLNQIAAVNSKADLAKNSAVSPAEPLSGTDSFANTLRQQLTANKPLTATPETPAASKPARTSQTAQADNTEVPANPAATAKAANPANSNPSRAVDKKGSATQQHSSTDAASSDTDPATLPAATATQLPDTLPTLAEDSKFTASEDALALGAETAPLVDASTLMTAMPISPWMQTMMAMRPEQTATTVPATDATKDTTLNLGSGWPAADARTAAIDTTAPPTTPPLAQEMALQTTALTFDSRLAGAMDEAAKRLEWQSGEDAAMAASQANVSANQPLPTTQILNPLADAGAMLSSQITTPFANQERWQAAMNQQVVNMVGSGDELASLTLSPPDLGPVQVVLKVDNQSVDTTFISDNPLVRQALEDGLQDLRERMASQGLQLGQTFVGDGQQAQQHFNSQQPAHGQSHGESQADASDTVAEAVPAVSRRVALGAVDTFA